ncbi:MAG: glycerol-3-phosphate dehydrogenase/oxidase [Chloroflexota bacterium]|nr:glycerol-3-phosphate dehydrogenase/oxidase [Chloroflexota bacterium]
MRSEYFDVLVVGGGITGAGVAWDAAARGLRVALIEQGDYAGGTSSRSSKLIHGGLRYLAQGHLALTREAVAERGRLQRLAPHLVDLLPFAFPVFGGPAERLKLTAGLWLYDAFAAGSGAPRHSWLGRGATLAVAPGLRPDGLSGAFIYRDARTDDARMVVEVLRAATGAGAAVANHVAMQGLLTAKGRAVGVAAEDRLGHQAFEIRARVVVLAAGVWLNRLVPPSPSGDGTKVRPAKGVHLFLMPGRVPLDTAFYLSTTSDKRLIFVVPWLGRTMVGTTDTAYSGDLVTPTASVADVRYLLDAVNAAFPAAAFAPSDVLSSQAGLRPLISDGAGSNGNTAAISREDRVFETETGAIAIAGGKLTTFRRMAEKVVDRAAKRLSGPRGVGPSPTAHFPLGGFPTPLDAGAFSSWRAAALATAAPAQRARRARLIERYGAHYTSLEDLIATEPALGDTLLPGEPFLKAEVSYAIRHEQAVTVADVLAQRLRLALLTHDHGLGVAVMVADLLAREYGWDAGRRDQALAEYATDVAQYAVPT